jgi:hypothetical protein
MQGRNLRFLLPIAAPGIAWGPPEGAGSGPAARIGAWISAAPPGS